MKKFFLSIISFICILCGVFAVDLSFERVAAESAYDDLVDFTVEVESGRDIRVLQLTDTQIIDVAQSNRPGWAPDIWTTDKMNEVLFRCMIKIVTDYNPDLIIITGDLIYGEFDDNGSALTRLIAVMESFEIPWAPVFGNHDNESKRGVDWQCQQLENAEHCLFKQRSLTGNGNYSVGLAQDGVLKRVFYMLDTNGCGAASEETLANGHTQTSAGLAQDQIDWYMQSMTKVKALYPNISFSMGYHIQNYAFVSAMAKYGYPSIGVNIDAHVQKAETDFGYFGHAAGGAWDSSGTIFNDMKAMGVDSIFVGHEHQNSASIVYDGVRLAYGLKTGRYDTINWLTDGVIVDNEVTCGTITGGNPLPGVPLVGGTAINVSQEDGSITSHHIYYEQEETKILDDVTTNINKASDMAYSSGLSRKYFEYYSTGAEGAHGDVYRANNLGKAYIAINLGDEVMTDKNVTIRVRVNKYDTVSDPQLFFYKNEDGYDISAAAEGEYTSLSFTPTFDGWTEVDITEAVQLFLNEDGVANSFIMVFQANGVSANAEVFLNEIRSWREEKSNVGKEWEDTFYATLQADGKPVLVPVAFHRGDSKLVLPQVPQKEGYFAAWENYTLADQDCVINAVYLAEDEVKKITFVADGNAVGEIAVDQEGKVYGEEPAVPQKLGYTGVWESYTVDDSDITVNAVYTPVTYYVTFTADGAQVGEKVAFTVEDTEIAAPEVPEKAGYTGVWESYALGAGDITVNAVYTEIPQSSADSTESTKEEGKKKGGCGSNVSVLLPTVIALGCVAVFKKKEN